VLWVGRLSLDVLWLSLRELFENYDLDLRNPHNFTPPRNDHSLCCCDSEDKVWTSVEHLTRVTVSHVSRIPHFNFFIIVYYIRKSGREKIYL
jgi:hypothetical protein